MMCGFPLEFIVWTICDFDLSKNMNERIQVSLMVGARVKLCEGYIFLNIILHNLISKVNTFIKF